MTSLLNPKRPPAFCPGCTHDQVVHAVDKALDILGRRGDEVAIVSDIGCSGLFDTFFNTHAFHGLHGRALTYATGLKMARPELTVLVVMGDGGLGIGGAHLLASCRRNLDLTLLVLNNFNYGMTGGQCSPTTPPEAATSSSFLNTLERPLDLCQLVETAGAVYVGRALGMDKRLPATIAEAIGFKGFSVLDIWAVCPGRYAKKNSRGVSSLEAQQSQLPVAPGIVHANARAEYREAYTSAAAGMSVEQGVPMVERHHQAPGKARQEVLMLGAAGQFVNTVGELLCLAGISGGLQASLKSDYPITVLRGHSICEVVLDPQRVGFTGIRQPGVVLAIAREGVARKKAFLSALPEEAVIYADSSIDLPATSARVEALACDELAIARNEKALALLSYMAVKGDVLTTAMLATALPLSYSGELLERAQTLVARVIAHQ
jgi:pyruvate/2-oxoacid:ferredoxin oxidoreductase beta subunit